MDDRAADTATYSGHCGLPRQKRGRFQRSRLATWTLALILSIASVSCSCSVLEASDGDGTSTADVAAPSFESLLAQGERPTAAQAQSFVAGGAVLVDVRSQSEWDSGHAKGAVYLYWLDVNDQAADKLPNKQARIITYCAHGPRAWYAARKLRKLGFTHVLAMKGGFKDLEEVGYPVQ